MSESALEDAVTDVGNGLTARVAPGIVSFTTNDKFKAARELTDRPSVTRSAAQRLVDVGPS